MSSEFPKQPSAQESVKNPEETSRVILRFLRHGKKESHPIDADPNNLNKIDEMVQLTGVGRKEIIGNAADPSLIDRTIAYGSGRDRAEHTALLTALGNHPGITGEESLEELKKKISGELNIENKGKEQNKSRNISRLDMLLDINAETQNEYVRTLMDVYQSGHLMPWIVEESDEKAQELHDTNSITYSRMAAQIACIIEDNLRVAKAWNKLVLDPNKKYKEEGDALHKVMGTHQSIQESFLAKVIYITKGTEERDAFIASLISPSGFDFGEGFEVEIVSNLNSENPDIRIAYKREKTDEKEGFIFDEIVSSDTLQQIIKEGKR